MRLTVIEQHMLVSELRPDLSARVQRGELELRDATGVMKRQAPDIDWAWLTQIIRRDALALQAFMRSRNLG